MPRLLNASIITRHARRDLACYRAPDPRQHAFTDDEREGIILAVSSAFRTLKKFYAKIVPIFQDFGFTHHRLVSS